MGVLKRQGKSALASVCILCGTVSLTRGFLGCFLVFFEAHRVGPSHQQPDACAGAPQRGGSASVICRVGRIFIKL